jgi:hypothetical protein
MNVCAADMVDITRILMQDYLTKYTTNCEAKKIKAVESVVSSFEEAIRNQYSLDSLLLKGSNPELRYSRIDDEKLEVILAPLLKGGNLFLRKLDLSYNEISNKGAGIISKFLIVIARDLGGRHVRYDYTPWQ